MKEASLTYLVRNEVVIAVLLKELKIKEVH
jgi:hypothetical protein